MQGPKMVRITATNFRKLMDVARLAGELCDAIDRAAEDIGGSRPVADILKDLGHAVDKTESLLLK